MTPRKKNRMWIDTGRYGVLAAVDLDGKEGETRHLPKRQARAILRYLNNRLSEAARKGEREAVPDLEESGWWIFIDNVPARIVKMVYPHGWVVG